MGIEHRRLDDVIVDADIIVVRKPVSWRTSSMFVLVMQTFRNTE